MGMLGIDAAQTCSNIITLATQLIFDYYYLMDEEPIDPFPGGGGPGGGTGSNPPGGNDPIAKQAVLNTTRPSPCDAVELAVSLAGNAAIQQVIDSIKNRYYEWASVLKTLNPENSDTISVGGVYTDGKRNSVLISQHWDSLNGYSIGSIHNHGDNSAPSPADAIGAIRNLSDMVSNPNISVSQMENYIRNYSTIVVTGGHVYTFSIKNPSLVDSIQATNYDKKLLHDNYIQKAISYLPKKDVKSYTLNELLEAGEYSILFFLGEFIHMTKHQIGTNGQAKLLKLNSNNKVISIDPCIP